MRTETPTNKSANNPEFKAGDKLLCLNGSGYKGSEFYLQEGGVYEFQEYDVDPNFIKVKGAAGGWLKERFELLEFKEVGATATPATKDTNPKDGAATSRLDLSLVPQTAIAYTALAFTEGALKYGAYNWRDAGVLASVYVAASLRHIYKWYNGEECDPDTGVPHLASAMACLAVLVDAKEIGKLKDDRPPMASLGIVLKEFEHKVKLLQQKFPNGPKRHTEKS